MAYRPTPKCYIIFIWRCWNVCVLICYVNRYGLRVGVMQCRACAADSRLLQRDVSPALWRWRVDAITHDVMVTHDCSVHTWRHHWVAARRLACGRHRQVGRCITDVLIMHSLVRPRRQRRLEVDWSGSVFASCMQRVQLYCSGFQLRGSGLYPGKHENACNWMAAICAAASLALANQLPLPRL